VYQNNTLFTFILNLLFLHFAWINLTPSFNAPAWTTALETIAYTTFMLSLYFLPRFKPVYKYIILIIIGILLHDFGPQLPLFNQYTGSVYVLFFSGSLLYHFHLRFQTQSQSRQLLFITTLILISLASIFSPQHFFAGATYRLVTFPALIFLAVNLKPLSFLLSLTPLQFLGKISYALYIFHFPLQLMIVTSDQLKLIHPDYSSPLFFFTYISLLITIAYIGYRYLELPAQHRLRSLYLSHL